MEKEIRVANEAVLLSKKYKHMLAKRFVQLDQSRQVATATIVETLLAFKDRGGRILDEFGAELTLGPRVELDERGDPLPLRRGQRDLEELIYGRDDARSYNSAIKVYATQMPERRTKGTLLRRFQYFDAALQLLGLPVEIEE